MKTKNLVVAGLVILFAQLSLATGVQPDTPMVAIRASAKSGQIGLQNTEAEPMLLLTSIINDDEDQNIKLIAVPSVSRVEANGRQVVRFILENKSSEKITSQHIKRVRFEGVPAKKATNGVQVNVRYELPIIISPDELQQIDEPWKQLKWEQGKNQITVANPTPYVVRMSQSMSVSAGGTNYPIKMLPRPYILPGEILSAELPKNVSLTDGEVTFTPASPYGFESKRQTVNISVTK